MAVLLVSIAVSLVVIAAVQLYIHLSPRHVPKGLQLVPGPPNKSIFGHGSQLSDYPNQKLVEWAREYGELFRIRLGTEDWIFLNSPETVKEILDKQAAITSGRSSGPVLKDVVSGGMRFFLMGYTPLWRKLRAKVHNSLLTPKAAAAMHPSQEFEAKQLMHDLLKDNENEADFYQHTRRYTTSVMMTVTYGKRVPVWDCDDVKGVYQIMHDFSVASSPGNFIADIFPVLTRLPAAFQWWRKRALGYYHNQARLWTRLYNELKAQMDTGQAPACFVKDLIESDLAQHDISQLQAAFLAGSMIEAGSETTSSSLNSAIKLLAANPTAQRMAQAELDQVVGSSRSPKFSDEAALPYIRAIVKEVLRLRPAITLGSPHRSTKELVYKNFFIPSGTVISLFQYSIHSDPSIWPEPESFKPERYLAYPLPSGAYSGMGDPRARDHFSFGAGRRICPGMHMAENSLFITLANILWAFDILPPSELGDRHDLIDVSDEAYEIGGDTVPKPFKVRFRPKSDSVARIIEKEWEDARRYGFTFNNVKVDVDGVAKT